MVAEGIGSTYTIGVLYYILRMGHINAFGTKHHGWLFYSGAPDWIARESCLLDLPCTSTDSSKVTKW